MNLLGRTTVIGAILLLACIEASFGNGADSAASLLSSLSSTVTERSVLVEGSLPYSPGIDIWSVVVNDSAVFAVEAAKKGGSVPLRLVIALRDGNNTIGIDGLKKALDSTVSVRRWQTHVYVKSDQEPNRFAILLKGESDSATNEDIEAVRAQLVGSGIADENIAVPKTRSELEDAFAKIREKAGTKDKVLVYFRGRGALSTSEGEPILLASSEPAPTDGWLPVSELTREAIGLPPVSYALDINFQSGLADPFARRLSGTSDTVQQQNPDQRAFGWLHSVVPESGGEILLSNPFRNGPPGGLTRLMLSRISVRPENGCTTLADIGSSVFSGASNSRGAPEAVYFAGERAYSSFCLFPSNTSTQQLAVNVSKYPHPDPFMLVGKVEVTVPAGITGFWREVAVDSVIVRHRFASESYGLIDNRVVELVSLTEGQHLIELRVGVGSKIVASGRTTFEMSSPGLEVRSESEDLSAEILRPATRKSVTSSGFFTVGFIVADKKVDSVRYEMRNNGVAILRGIAGGHKARQNIEILRRIPVSVGSNNIVIEVRRDKETRSARCLVTRRVEQPLRAVLVGADHVEGLNQLNGVPADVASMKRVLLNYTDVKPKNLVTLVGSNATGTAVREALLGSSVATNPSDPMIQGGGEETFLLYFSGYGTTLLDSTRKPTARCILLADFEPGDAEKRCISTADLDQMLDAWTSAIVIFDTSYDGLSGTSQRDSIRGFLSRAFGDYLSPDVEWRASSGTDRVNRVFLVGSKTNTAALESTVPPQGLFTGSLVEAIAERARSGPPHGVQLFDVFASARTKTIAKSGKNQIPLIKGSLASPFYFKLRSAEDLATEARAIDLGILDDIQSHSAFAMLISGRNQQTKPVWLARWGSVRFSARQRALSA